jgi:hypothetical protein
MSKRDVNRRLQIKINNYLLYACSIEKAFIDD